LRLFIASGSWGRTYGVSRQVSTADFTRSFPVHAGDFLALRFQFGGIVQIEINPLSFAELKSASTPLPATNLCNFQKKCLPRCLVFGYQEWTHPNGILWLLTGFHRFNLISMAAMFPPLD
jgi:hypothetical protein